MQDMVEMLQPPEAVHCNEKGRTIALTVVSTSLYRESQQYQILRPKVLCVPHVSQALSWDCGLACLLMVLRTAGDNTQDLSSLHKLCPSKSVWTVDIAHLLRQFGLEVVFTTMTLGTNPGFAKESFYGQMHEDEIRVEALFREAVNAGIEIQQRSVPARELQQILTDRCHLVIALVDKVILERGLALWSSQISEDNFGYKGHYIVLCGYDSEADHYIFRDPDPRAAAIGLCSAESSVMEDARQAFGTDEDLLIVKLPSYQQLTTSQE